MTSGNFREYQSAYRAGHWTGTALPRLQHGQPADNCRLFACARYFGCVRRHRLHFIVWSTGYRSWRSCVGLVAFVFDWQDSVRRPSYITVITSDVSIRCPSMECSWSVVVGDVHFSSRPRRCSTLRSPPPCSIRWRHAALRRLVSFRRFTVWCCVALCQRYFTLVPRERSREIPAKMKLLNNVLLIRNAWKVVRYHRYEIGVETEKLFTLMCKHMRRFSNDVLCFRYSSLISRLAIRPIRSYSLGGLLMQHQCIEIDLFCDDDNALYITECRMLNTVRIACCHLISEIANGVRISS